MGSRSPRAKHVSRRHREHHVKESSTEYDHPDLSSGLPKEITIVEVKNPQTQGGKNRRMFTIYEVCLKTNSKAFALQRSSVRRRYSDFVWLQKWLQDHNEGFGKKTPSLPPKKFLKRFEKEFIEERMKGLQRFLKRVIEYNVFLSDKALHLFLQSSLDIPQIQAHLLGKPVEVRNGLQSSPSSPELSRPQVFSSAFPPHMTSSLEDIPERCESRSLLNVSSEDASSRPCSYQSNSMTGSISLRTSDTASDEDSSTEADAVLGRGSSRNSREETGAYSSILNCIPTLESPPQVSSHHDIQTEHSCNSSCPRDLILVCDVEPIEESQDRDVVVSEPNKEEGLDRFQTDNQLGANVHDEKHLTSSDTDTVVESLSRVVIQSTSSNSNDSSSNN